MNSISERLLKLRSNKTQVNFCKEIEFDQSNYSKYERNEVKPGTDFYILLAKKLNVNINWILTGEGNMYMQQSVTNQNTDQLINRIRELETELNNLKTAIKGILEKTDKPEKTSKKNFTIPLNKYGKICFN